MTAPIDDATMEREIGELYDALLAAAPMWPWAKANPTMAADSLKLGGRVREAFLVAISGEGARAPAAYHKRGFWWD